MVRIEMGASDEVGVSLFFRGAFMLPLEDMLSLARRRGSQGAIREVMGPPTSRLLRISRDVSWSDALNTV